MSEGRLVTSRLRSVSTSSKIEETAKVKLSSLIYYSIGITGCTYLPKHRQSEELVSAEFGSQESKSRQCTGALHLTHGRYLNDCSVVQNKTVDIEFFVKRANNLGSLNEKF